MGSSPENRLEWAVAAYAVYGLEAALVPMFEMQRPRDWRFILADCAAKAVICATEPMVRELEEAKAQIPSLEHVIGLSLPPQDARSYATLLQQGADAPCASTGSAIAINDDVANLVTNLAEVRRPSRPKGDCVL